MTIEITGLQSTLQNLVDYGENVQQRVADAVAGSALRVRNEAGRRVPRDTSRLASSIQARRDNASGTAYTVGTNVANDGGYAAFIEFGVGPLGAASIGILTPLARQAMAELGYVHGPTGPFPPLDILERWVRRHGIPVEATFPIALAIFRRGFPARPYLFPALEGERQNFERRVAEAVRR